METRGASKQMSADTGMPYQSCSMRQFGGVPWRGRAPGEPWKLVEILAMVLGFVVFVFLLGTYANRYFSKKPYDLFGLYASEKTK